MLIAMLIALVILTLFNAYWTVTCTYLSKRQRYGFTTVITTLTFGAVASVLWWMKS